MPQSTLSRRASADQAELQAAESLADMDRILTQSLSKATEFTSQSLAASSSNQPVVNAVEVSLNGQTVQTVNLTGLSAESVVKKLRVEESPASIEMDQSSKEASILPSQSENVTLDLNHVNQSNGEEVPSNQSNEEETSSNQPEKSTPDSSGTQYLVDAETVHENRQLNQTTDHQSGGTVLKASDPQMSAGQENNQDDKMDTVQEHAEELHCIPNEKESGNSKDTLNENVQVRSFSVFIVCLLQKTGDCFMQRKRGKEKPVSRDGGDAKY